MTPNQRTRAAQELAMWALVPLFILIVWGLS